MERRSLMFECLQNDNRRLKSQVQDLQQQLSTLRAKLELRNKEILSLMKEDIIDLTNDEDYMLPELKRKSLDEFISWAFDEHEEEKDEEVYYQTPPTKKLKF